METPELPQYASRESAKGGNRLPNLDTGDLVSADRQLFGKFANALVPQSTTEADSLAKSGSTSSPGNADGAKTHSSHREEVDSQPPTPAASQNTYYPGYIHIKANPNTRSLWHPDAQNRDNISVVSQTKTSHPPTPGSQVPSYPWYYQQLESIPIAAKTHSNKNRYWDHNSPEGEYTNLTLSAKNRPPTSFKENQGLSFSPANSPTASDACSNSNNSPTSPSSSKRTRLRAEVASTSQRRKSLDDDIARLITALVSGYPHQFGQRNALQGHLGSQLQVVERQREALVARGEETDILDKEIEKLRGALGKIDGDEGNWNRRRMNEGILMGSIVKREVLGEPEQER